MKKLFTLITFLAMSFSLFAQLGTPLPSCDPTKAVTSVRTNNYFTIGSNGMQLNIFPISDSQLSSFGTSGLSGGYVSLAIEGSATNNDFVNNHGVPSSGSVYFLEIIIDGNTRFTSPFANMASYGATTTNLYGVSASQIQWGVTHYWRYWGIGSSGNEESCPWYYFTPLFAPPLLGSTATTYNGCTTSAPAFQVNYNRAVVNYTIELNVEPDFSGTPILQTYTANYAANDNPVLTFSTGELVDNTTYFVRVKALPDYSKCTYDDTPQNAAETQVETWWSWDNGGVNRYASWTNCSNYVNNQVFSFTYEAPEPQGCTEKHRITNPTANNTIPIEGESRSVQYNPETHQLKAWVLYDHYCGDISIDIFEGGTYVGTKTVNPSTTEHITTDCGDLITFPLNEDLSSSTNPSLNFKFYLTPQPCIGSTPAPPVDGKSLTKGEVMSPVVYDYGLSADGMLPISLLSFSGSCKDGSVRLNWRTASETNNDYFTIERGESNGKAIRWKKIAEVKGAGNSSMPLSYGYTDYVSNGETVYYRLKQTDFNGQFEYFNPAVVSCPKNQEDIRIYPNPTTGMIYIQTATGASTEFRLYSVEGRLLKSDNGTEVDLSGYAKGVYFLKLNNTTFKVVKE